MIRSKLPPHELLMSGLNTVYRRGLQINSGVSGRLINLHSNCRVTVTELKIITGVLTGVEVEFSERMVWKREL